MKRVESTRCSGKRALSVFALLCFVLTMPARAQGPKLTPRIALTSPAHSSLLQSTSDSAVTGAAIIDNREGTLLNNQGRNIAIHIGMPSKSDEDQRQQSQLIGKPESLFDFLGFIKTAYDIYNKIKNFLEPDPNLADLITQAKNEIIDEINLVRAEEQIANVNALIDEYVIYLNNPPSQQTIEAWIRDAINAANQFEIIIGSPAKSPRIGYLCAKSYNMIIPLMALMMQKSGIRTQDILPLFEDVIITNKVLIGNYCWEEMPNAPVYWDVVWSSGNYVGKLLKCYHEGVIDYPEYLNIYDIVWTANEELRKQTIEEYEEIWFHISNESWDEAPLNPNNNKYLCAHSRPHRTDAKVSVADLRPEDTDFLWRLEFQTGHLVKIVHWSGKYLAIANNKKDIIITPKPNWQNEVFYFKPGYHATWDRVAITANIDHGYWLYAVGNSVEAGEVAFAPGLGGAWIILYANRTALRVGHSAFPCPADYDGDGKVDLGMKTNDGRWFIDFANNGFGNWDREITTLSLPSIDQYAQPAAADYDGDGKADIAVKYDLTGQWCMDYAANGYGSWDVKLPYGPTTLFYSFHPVPADYDGDGKTDVAIFVNTGRWSIDYSVNGFTGWEIHPHAREVYYPTANTYPAPVDYDGDGKADVSIKLDDGRWVFDLAYNGFAQTNDWDLITATSVNYGDITAHPVPGPYFWSSWYNHRADLGVWTESGRWMIDSYLGVGGTPIDWTSNPIYGSKNAFPIPADYDGDGMMDLSVIEEDGTWSIDFSTNDYLGWDWSSTLSIPTGVWMDEQRNSQTAVTMTRILLSNFPNPFNSYTTIHYSVLEPGRVVVRIYNLIGQEIVTLVNEKKDIGEYHVSWDGRDESGRMMPTGIYIYQRQTQKSLESRKMLLIR